MGHVDDDEPLVLASFTADRRHDRNDQGIRGKRRNQVELRNARVGAALENQALGLLSQGLEATHPLADPERGDARDLLEVDANGPTVPHARKLLWDERLVERTRHFDLQE